MIKRLTEMYPVGTTVKILLNKQTWQSGVVVSHQYPAVWVKTKDGRSWFVTNRRRIQLANSDAKE